MNTYWLYLESYTFVFSETTKYFFYNSLSGNNFVINKKEEINLLISSLLDPENMYCIELTQKERSLPVVEFLIKQLRASFAGDIIDKRFVKSKPVILYPKMRLMRSLDNILYDKELDLGDKILSYLHSVTFQLTGNCKLNCLSCGRGYKQIPICKKNNGQELSLEAMEKVVQTIFASPVSNIYLKGGNIFLYSELDKLEVHIVSHSLYTYYILCNYEHILMDPLKFCRFQTHKNVKFRIQLLGDIEEEKISNLLKIVNKFMYYIEFEFVVETKKQYDQAVIYSEKFDFNRVSFRPIINKQNLSFFANYIFWDEETILSHVHSKKSIYRHQTLNILDFGDVTIMANGDVYANVNMPKLGNIKEMSISSLLYNELRQGNSWLRVRNQKPCEDCIYQWLCPSPSSYELVMNKPNLCRVKP